MMEKARCCFHNGSKQDAKQETAGVEKETSICRGCLGTDRKMGNAMLFAAPIKDLTGITISRTDGLPQWLCYECSALLQKCIKFRRKMMNSQYKLFMNMLKGVPIDRDVEATPHLSRSVVLHCDIAGSQDNELQKPSTSKCESDVPASIIETESVQVKDEPISSDDEDNIAAEEFSVRYDEISPQNSSKLPIDKMSDVTFKFDDEIEQEEQEDQTSKVDDDTDAPVLIKQDSVEIIEEPLYRAYKRDIAKCTNNGLIDELPVGGSLEPPVAKRPRSLAKRWEHIDHPQHIECDMSSSPRAAELTPQPHRRRATYDPTDTLSHHGSEEEEAEDCDENLSLHMSIPRMVRVLLAADEDTPPEAEAQGTVHTHHHVDDMMHGPTSLFHFDWQAFPIPPVSPHLRREKFVGKCGPTVGPIANPYEAFVLIWDRPIMEHIARQTNMYAQEYAKHRLERGDIGPKSRITLWRDTDVDELYVYFALLIAMGIVVKCRVEDYWSGDKNLFSVPGFSIHMSVKRFQLLSRCLQFNNYNLSPNTPTRSQANILQIAPICNHLNLKFSSLYRLSQNIVLGECLIQCHNKSVDIKTYEVCDSKSGYSWRFECDEGSQVEAQQVVLPGSIPNLVLRLLRGLEHRGHTDWMDNYYNSPALARVLKSLGYDCAGTLRTNRQFVPDLIKNLKISDMKVGEVSGCTSGDVDLMVWREQHRVAMISTYHGPNVCENKPSLIKDYTVSVAAVDNKDQLLFSCPIERQRTPVWYKQMFKRLLNVSVLNAYILYKHTHYTKHREFRTELVAQILDHHQPRVDIAITTVRGVPKFSAELILHLPAELPYGKSPGGKSGKQRRKCVVCKVKRTRYVCQACNVSLCFNFAVTSCCYVRYHT